MTSWRITWHGCLRRPMIPPFVMARPRCGSRLLCANEWAHAIRVCSTRSPPRTHQLDKSRRRARPLRTRRHWHGNSVSRRWPTKLPRTRARIARRGGACSALAGRPGSAPTWPLPRNVLRDCHSPAANRNRWGAPRLRSEEQQGSSRKRRDETGGAELLVRRRRLAELRELPVLVVQESVEGHRHASDEQDGARPEVTLGNRPALRGRRGLLSGSRRCNSARV